MLVGRGLAGVSVARMLIPDGLRPKSCDIRGYGLLSGVKLNAIGPAVGRACLGINVLILFYQVD